jgi:hypothetical protein
LLVKFVEPNHVLCQIRSVLLLLACMLCHILMKMQPCMRRVCSRSVVGGGAVSLHLPDYCVCITDIARGSIAKPQWRKAAV